MNDAAVVELAQHLIRFPSVSRSSNAAISDFVEQKLDSIGFACERVEYIDANNVRKVNLIAKRGEGIGGIVYSAHTDVVPADDWLPNVQSAFDPKIASGRLYGRGSCDMKGSLAAAITAAEQIEAQKQSKPIYFCISADEEIAMVGARKIVAQSMLYQEMVNHKTVAIVGEPTGLDVFYTHKGTLLLTLRSHGLSAHTSSLVGINANDRMFAVLPELEKLKQRTERDQVLMNHEFDPPTLSWNWIIRNEPFVSNITPSLAELCIFIRPMPDVQHASIVDAIERIAQQAGLEFIKSEEAPCLVGDPNGDLVREMLSITGQSKPKSACYATDGSVLRGLNQIVICGPGSIAQAHRNDEWIELEQLHRGVDVFKQAFERFSCDSA